MKITDEQVIESFRRTKSLTKTGRDLGVTTQAIEQRIMRLRLRGIDLPTPARGKAKSNER